MPVQFANKYLWKIVEKFGKLWKDLFNFAIQVVGLMKRFIGEYKSKLDDKGRLVFPASFRDMFPEGCKICLVAKKDLYACCIELFTQEQWEEEAEMVKQRLNLFNREHASFWREYMRGRAKIEPSSGLNRISLPSEMLEQVGINQSCKEVVFVGADHKIEIWSKEKYSLTAMDEESYEALAEKILA